VLRWIAARRGSDASRPCSIIITPTHGLDDFGRANTIEDLSNGRSEIRHQYAEPDLNSEPGAGELPNDDPLLSPLNGSGNIWSNNVEGQMGRPLVSQLFERYLYFRDRFVEKSIETHARKQEHEIEQYQREFDIASYSLKARDQKSPSELIAMFTFPWARLAQDSNWLALAAVDSFFAWTEHIFIHLAVLEGRVVMGEEVAQLAESDWGTKFKRALNISDPVLKGYFDELIIVRRQLRNFVAHGAFGKEGEAFSFHSAAGAGPVAFDHKPTKFRLSLTPELAFDNQQALLTIEKFISYLWSGQREPAKLYIQESDLPLILPIVFRHGIRTPYSG
jgi:hypothetical protein